jgi:hypothetical protein
MDAIIYKEGLCSPSALIRFGIQEFFIVHMFGVFVGHLNRAKVGWDYGPLRYVFNNPKMPIWHHSKVSPQDHPHGMNFGLSFSVCDYILGTAHVPKREKIMSSVLKTTKNILKIFGINSKNLLMNKFIYSSNRAFTIVQIPLKIKYIAVILSSIPPIRTGQ